MAVTTVSLAVKDANSASQNLAVFQDPALVQRYAIALDAPGEAVYRASANFTPQATAAVTIITITGSATKTVRIRRILLAGVSTGLGGSTFQLQRTSALGAGGTLVAPTVSKVDSGTVAPATAVVNHWTTTLKAAGTAVGGPMSTFQFVSNTVTTPTVGFAGQIMAFPEFGVPVGQAIVLRGVGDILEVQNITPTNLGAGTVVSYTVEWAEDAS